ncbi:ABC transporter substrate-binding protein [Agreia pratensis]|uniref:ABC transporter substrate-binding protein n=1 Tax=Agreia pratensis TaxID=150121 RepID=UPI001E424746|nr:ABC transporter substrate-binding protein [Agreia pratensis]
MHPKETMMFRWKRLVAVAAVVALGLTGCSASTGDSGDSSGTLTIGGIVQASTFAAAQSNWANESPYMQAVYDTILTADTKGEVQPGLATKWEYNEDKTVLTLTLRDDVKFTDGTALDAEAVAQNLVRFRDGAGPNASYLVDMTDAVATDATTVTITLKAANPALLTYLTQNAGLVEAPSAFESADIQTVPVGSGPYTLDTAATVIGTSYVFNKNPDYWKPENQHYDKIVMNVYTDPTALLNAVKGGQVNATNTVNNNDIAQMEASGFTSNPLELNWAGLTLMDRNGTVDPALSNVKVRQAINYAFDKDAMLKTVENGFGTPTTQVFPERSAAYDKSLDSAYDYDPAKAKELLAEAGYADGVTIQMPSSPLLGTSTFTLIQQQLADVGITVEYGEPGNNFIADILTPKYPVVYIPLQQGGDWELIQFLISPTATFNPYKTSDDTVNGYIATVQNGTEEEAAKAAKDLNKYLVDNAWFAPWYRTQSTYMTDANTSVVMQPGNAVPYLWNITPKA